MKSTPTTVGITPADKHLASFPRPANDNGRALHFVLDIRQNNLDEYIPYMKRMQMRWTCIYGDDELVTVRAAKQLMDQAGIMSVLRIQARGDMPKSPGSWAGYVKHAVKTT
jgi:hypothetical protein